jgi:hypothetical protein
MHANKIPYNHTEIASKPFAGDAKKRTVDGKLSDFGRCLYVKVLN